MICRLLTKENIISPDPPDIELMIKTAKIVVLTVVETVFFIVCITYGIPAYQFGFVSKV